jgi:phosphomannomutase/phosphoglucomutase
MKFVRQGARPVTGESGLFEIGRMIVEGQVPEPGEGRGTQLRLEDKTGYIEHLLSHVALDSLAPMKVVVNSGNGLRRCRP